MRVFAVSDLHVDHEANARWVQDLSLSEYRDDVLILAGDLSDSADLVCATIEALAKRFKQVMFVPGNHELWVVRHQKTLDSFEKFEHLCQRLPECGALMSPWQCEELAIVPLFAWYDFSFCQPIQDLRFDGHYVAQRTIGQGALKIQHHRVIAPLQHRPGSHPLGSRQISHSALLRRNDFRRCLIEPRSSAGILDAHEVSRRDIARLEQEVERLVGTLVARRRA